MTDPLVVSTTEYATVRVFSINAANIAGDMASADMLKPLLGAEHFLPEKAEIVEVSKLGSLGLGGYLGAGYGVDPAELQTQSDALARAEGHIALVPASAFDGKAQRLSPKPPLKLIGLFHEEASQAHRPMAPTRATPDDAVVPPPPQTGVLSEGPKRKGAPVIVAAMGIILVLLVLLLVL